MKTSFWNPDDLRYPLEIFPKLREKIYGRRLMNSAAVKALESFYRILSLSEGADKLFAVWMVDTVENIGCVQLRWKIPVFKQEAGLAMRPFQEAFSSEDPQFFRDFGEAFSRRLKPKHRSALFIADYLLEQRTKTRQVVTTDELEDALSKCGLSGNISRILYDELGLDAATWPIKKSKPGRKSRRQA